MRVGNSRSYTYTMVLMVMVGRRLLVVVVTVTVVGLVTVVKLVLITLLVGGATASQKAIAKGSPMMSSAMTSTAIHATVSRIPGTTSCGSGEATAEVDSARARAASEENVCFMIPTLELGRVKVGDETRWQTAVAKSVALYIFYSLCSSSWFLAHVGYHACIIHVLIGHEAKGPVYLMLMSPSTMPFPSCLLVI